MYSFDTEPGIRLSVLCLAVAFCGQAGAATFSAVNDFSLSANPNGRWSYGSQGTLGGTLSLLPMKNNSALAGVEAWGATSNSGDVIAAPFVARNTTNRPLASGGLVMHTDELRMSPGPAGEFAVARWTSPFPVATPVAISGSFSALGNSNNDVHIAVNGVLVWNSVLGGAGDVKTFSGNFTTDPLFPGFMLSPGDTVDFIVGPNGTHNGDNSGLSVAIVGTAPGTTGPVSDKFQATTLNPAWTLMNPAGGSYALIGTNLLLLVPSGSNHDPQVGGNNAVRLMQNVSDSDFQVEAKFETKPALKYQIQGLLVEQDVSNYIRFEVVSDGSNTYVSAHKVVNGVGTSVMTMPIAFNGPVWLRIGRTGSSWTGTWSDDGTTYNSVSTFTQAFSVSRTGMFAGNYGSPAATAPAFIAAVDYFSNTASPVQP